MRKFNKLMTLLIVLTLILSTASMSFAQGINEGDIKTGFYIVDGAGNNIFIDIYTYLNNKEEYLNIINKGLKNVLFVNQDKEGATLEEFLEKATFRELVLEDFEEIYKDERTDKDLKARDAFYSFTASLDKEEYDLDDKVTLTGQVLKLEEGLSGIDITVKIEKDGDLVNVGQFETDDNGEFEHIFTVPADLEAGTYLLTVKANEPVERTVVLDLVILAAPVDDEIPEGIINDIATKITSVFENIDDADKQSIIDAKSNIATITPEDWDIVLEYILTAELIAKFDDEADAKAKLQAAIEELAEISYSVDTEDLEASLMTYAETHLPTFRAIFGDEESAETIFGLIKDVILNIPKAITATQGNALVGATNENLIGIIEEVAKTTIYYTLDNGYETFRGKLSEVGLSIDILLDVRGKLADKIDTDNAAQIALINAYARTEANIEPIVELEIDENVEYTLQVLGEDVSTVVNWSSSNEEVATIYVDEKVVLTGLTEGTTTITAYRGTDKSNWIAKFDVEVVSILEIESVSAINGEVTIKFSKDIPGEHHGLIHGKLKLLLSINEGDAEEIHIPGWTSPNSSTFVIELSEIEATEEEQRLVYSVQLGEAELVFAEVIVIDAK